MSAEGGGEKTEQPTSKKLSDARNRGNVAKSRDLSSAMELLGAIALLKFGGWFIAEHMVAFTEKVLKLDLPTLAVPEKKEIIPHLLDWCIWLALLCMPFLAALCVVAVIANVLQTGFLFTTETLKLDLKKLNPISGLKRMFNTKNVVMLLMNIAKLGIILPIAWSTIYEEVMNVIVMVEMEAAGGFIYATTEILNLALKLAAILFILGVADYAYQRHKYIEGLKMSKQEIKEEFKQMEGDPKIKSKQRQIQMQQAMKRMMQEVPQAEVVVRNPTHFAVAISYKVGMAVPVVVAKGKDRVAERIIEEAAKARVPMVENPPLARELYKRVEIGDQIPEALFAAVAEILSSVMNAEQKRRMMDAFAKGAA